MNLIAVYGSLRPGEYNFKRFEQNYGRGLFTIIKKAVKLDGYNLYDLGPYPAVTKGENQLVVDIVRVNNKEALRHINEMEIGAGYKIENLKIDDLDVILYIFPENEFTKDRLIKSGDWKKHLKSRLK